MMSSDLNYILYVLLGWLIDKIDFFIIYDLLVICISAIAFFDLIIKKKKMPYIDLTGIIRCKIIQNAIYIIFSAYLLDRFIGGMGIVTGGVINDIIQFLLTLLPFSLLFGVIYTPISFLTSLFYIKTFKQKNIILWFVTTIPYFDLVVPLILKHICYRYSSPENE